MVGVYYKCIKIYLCLNTCVAPCTGIKGQTVHIHVLTVYIWYYTVHVLTVYTWYNSREVTIHTVIYGVHTRFWPTYNFKAAAQIVVHGLARLIASRLVVHGQARLIASRLARPWSGQTHSGPWSGQTLQGCGLRSALPHSWLLFGDSLSFGSPVLVIVTCLCKDL